MPSPSPPVLRNATSFELGDEGGLRHHRWIPLRVGDGYDAKRKKSKKHYLPHDVAKWWFHIVESIQKNHQLNQFRDKG